MELSFTLDGNNQNPRIDIVVTVQFQKRNLNSHPVDVILNIHSTKNKRNTQQLIGLPIGIDLLQFSYLEVSGTADVDVV